MKNQDAIGAAKVGTFPQGEKPISSPAEMDLDACPRCGEPVETIIWGQTNCPRCGLHFECC
jgi:uncharacterized protein (UPF0212 family)